MFGSSRAFGNQSNPFATNSKSSNSAFGLATTANSGQGFGNSGFGSSGFGSSGFGSSGFGSSGFGNSTQGRSGFGSSGFGSSGFGKSAPTATGNGAGFGNAGFGNAGFGSSAFGTNNNSNASLAFGTQGKTPSQSSPFGAFLNTNTDRHLAIKLMQLHQHLGLHKIKKLPVGRLVTSAPIIQRV